MSEAFAWAQNVVQGEESSHWELQFLTLSHSCHGETQEGLFRLWGFVSDKGSGVAGCGVFLCVFLHFREQPNISIYLLTESGPCDIVVTGLSKAVCFQLKGI